MDGRCKTTISKRDQFIMDNDTGERIQGKLRMGMLRALGTIQRMASKYNPRTISVIKVIHAWETLSFNN